MVLRSSNRLRNESEATWGLPQRSVSSSTSSSNFIQRAVSFQCISWFLSISNSFSSTNTWENTFIYYLYDLSLKSCNFLDPVQVIWWKAICSCSLSQIRFSKHSFYKMSNVRASEKNNSCIIAGNAKHFIWRSRQDSNLSSFPFGLYR